MRVRCCSLRVNVGYMGTEMSARFHNTCARGDATKKNIAVPLIVPPAHAFHIARNVGVASVSSTSLIAGKGRPWTFVLEQGSRIPLIAFDDASVCVCVRVCVCACGSKTRGKYMSSFSSYHVI